jgi:hypothetical protein
VGWPACRARLYAIKQQIPCYILLPINKVDVHDLPEETFHLALPHAHRHQFPLYSGRVLRERHGPFRLWEGGRQVIW